MSISIQRLKCFSGSKYAIDSMLLISYCSGNALQAAAAGGHTTIINLLLENKPPALVDTPGGHYGSALRAAVHSLNSDTVWALLEEKANPNMKIKNLGPLLDEAAGMGSTHRDIVRDLVNADAEADLSPKGSNGLHIMHRAAMFGMIELLEHCLEKGCQIDAVTTQGPMYNQRFGKFENDMTPLAYACAEGHISIVDLLLSRNASFELERPNSAIVWLAAYQGHADIVDLLLRRFKEKHSLEDTARLLLQRPHAETKVGQPILIAAASSGSADVVKVLIKHGARYESNSSNATPLYATATFGCPSVAELLIDYDRHHILDICINQKNINGRTALSESCSKTQTVIAKMLLDAGADYLVMDKDNTTPLQAACIDGNFNILLAIIKRAAQELDRSRFLEFLNNKRRPNGNVALIDCAERNHLSCLNLLLSHGADYTIPGNGNYTILHMASRHDNSAIMAAIVLKAAQDLNRQQFLDFLNTRHSSGKTALIDCAERGRQEACSILLRHGADYRIPGHAGNTPLHWSCMGGYPEVVKGILKQAESEESDSSLLDYINAGNKAGMTAFMEAARKNHLAAVKVLLSFGADYVTCRIDEGRSKVTALHDACHKGCREVATHLLEVAFQELDSERFAQFIDARNYQGKTPLHDAANTGRSRIVRTLVGKYNADYTLSNKNGVTALHMASFNGRRDSVSALLETAIQDQDRGRFVSFLDHKNRWQRTAFFDACEQGHVDVVRKLLDYGADYTAANDSDVTPLHNACWLGRHNVVVIILDFASKDPDRARVTSMLLNRRNRWKKTPLMDACETGRPEITRLLLEHGADYRLNNSGGSTALHYCVSHNRINCVRVLLEHAHLHLEEQGFGEFLNQQDRNSGASALHDAASHGHSDVGELLLSYKPIYDSLDSQKRSPLHYATRMNNLELLKALLERAWEDGDETRFRRFVTAQDEKGDSAWKDAKRGSMEILRDAVQGGSRVYEEVLKM